MLNSDAAAEACVGGLWNTQGQLHVLVFVILGDLTIGSPVQNCWQLISFGKLFSLPRQPP